MLQPSLAARQASILKILVRIVNDGGEMRCLLAALMREHLTLIGAVLVNNEWLRHLLHFQLTFNEGLHFELGSRLFVLYCLIIQILFRECADAAILFITIPQLQF